METLRVAAHEALDAVGQAQSIIGLTPDEILEIIRIEHEDWDRWLERMRLAGDLLAATGSPVRLDMMVVVDDPIASKADLEKLEQDRGYLAFVCGRAFRSCPYGPNDPRTALWELGYLNAKDDIG